MITIRTGLMAAFAMIVLSGCVSGEVLESAISTSATPVESKTVEDGMMASTAGPLAENETVGADNGALPGVETFSANPDGSGAGVSPANTELAYAPDTTADVRVTADPAATVLETSVSGAVSSENAAEDAAANLDIPASRGPTKTYLINGLMSAVPFIGYGFRNLAKKMPEAELYSYLTPVEGAAAVYPTIVSDIEKAYAKDPTVSVNLIGISLGADMATAIAENLGKKGIPVNYLGIVDGTNLRPIRDNVRKADNLTCSNLDCTRARARLAEGNTVTAFERKVYRSSHIPLGDNSDLHTRVIAQTASR